ncbi:hypothetical protein SCLCIDRAFT_142079 [Scleroderma citrinum Foug A]|uniref:Uncharacterized protein n=1 Tax=Scleroderma citrinum Foug A TaxID=1036808 RepID=A0A0C3CTX2_9AGAM|nr:hypothetical protein SCLCIDRAFT_142079 [Scleroderma citrinum Foug A]
MNKSADQACADDMNHLKTTVLDWIKLPPTDSAELVEPLDSGIKDGRGFDHDLTGCFLCPVDYDWEDSFQCEAIHDYHPDFLVTAHSWPSFLYKGGIYDVNNPSIGLFKGSLLVTAFKFIFTSPSSASKPIRSEHKKDQGPPNHHMRAHVAARIGMKSVSPHAIAYIAVQLHFALLSCGTWRITDGEFDYDAFYNNIIDFFESVETLKEKKFI